MPRTKKTTKADAQPKAQTLDVSVTIPDDVRQPLPVAFTSKLTDETVVPAKKWHDDAKAELKRRQGIFESLKRPLNDARNVVLKLEKESCDALARAITSVGGLLVAYQNEKDAERRRAEERAKQEAEDKARADRQKQLDALNAAAGATNVEAHRVAIQQQAAALQAAPIRAVPMPVQPVAGPVVNIPTRKTWSADVYDLGALVVATALPLIIDTVRTTMLAQSGGKTIDHPDMQRYVGALDVLEALQAQTGKGGLQYVQPNQVVLNDIAVQCQDNVPIAGVRGACKETPLTSRATVVEPAISGNAGAAQSADEWKI